MELQKLKDIISEKSRLVKRLKFLAVIKAIVILGLAINQLVLTTSMNRKLNNIISDRECDKKKPEGVITQYNISERNKWVGVTFKNDKVIVIYYNRNTEKIVKDTLQ